jgi:hypothetical protein
MNMAVRWPSIPLVPSCKHISSMAVKIIEHKIDQRRVDRKRCTNSNKMRRATGLTPRITQS